MKVSPQSEDIINKLLNGEQINSGDLSIGPLNPKAKICLEILSRNYTEMEGLSGAERAKKFLERYKKSSLDQLNPQLAEGEKDNKLLHAIPSEIQSINSSKIHEWRIAELQATSYRGLAPNGAQVNFPFEGKSNLIFGPNGSGKSSLIGAIIWVFTNTTITDADEENEYADIYERNSGTTKEKKLRKWPTSVTLPEKDIKTCSPDCSVSLKLISARDETSLWLRRTFTGQLEKGVDGKVWNPCEKLEDLNISPLDVQLSLKAPIVFGRRKIEDIKETKDILRLILGYEDLADIGTLAANVAKNRTILNNLEQKEVDNWEKEIFEDLKDLPDEFGPNEPMCNSLKTLADDKKITQEKIKVEGGKINLEIEISEKYIAKAIGIEQEKEGGTVGIGDSLTIIVENLKKKFPEIFPSIAKIELSSVLPPQSSKSSEERLLELEDTLNKYIKCTQENVKKRLELWRKEIIENSKVPLFLHIASFYEPVTGVCPVCDQQIKKIEIKNQLQDLKTMPPELRKDVKDYFRILKDELEILISSEIRILGQVSPKSRIENDWKLLKSSFAAAFQTITQVYDSAIEGIAKECVVQMSETPGIIPQNCPKEFSQYAKDLEEEIKKTFASIEILKWSSDGFLHVKENLENIITADFQNNKESLLAILSLGKAGAENIQALNRVKKALRKIYTKQGEVTKKKNDIILLLEMVGPFKEIKNLMSYSENEVRKIFGETEGAAIKNWKTLYPESPSGLLPENINLDAKGVEATLGGNDFKVPAKFFANSGLQRAIALSFYFALLEQHPGGLGFVLLDDTILSLDDEHRERWSQKILKPNMENKQFILTTHQRGFLNNCRYDFSSGRVVELNPREKNRKICFRPGNRLDRAKEELNNGNYTNAPTELRKYREELLATLDCYSPAPFFNHNNLSLSLTSFENLPDENPVAGKFMRQIIPLLKDNVVLRVLDPGSHHLTEADVTRPMVEDCLSCLEKVNRKLIGKINYLDQRNRPERQARELPLEIKAFFPEIPEAAQWKEGLNFQLIGRAAAKSESIVIESSESFTKGTLSPGSVVCVTGDTLDPIAKVGQWVILADEDISVQDGDLAAVELTDNKRLLRRVWSDGDCWRMESINPIKPKPIHSSFKNETAIRKIVGVLYEPIKMFDTASGSEWEPKDFQVINSEDNFFIVDVEGSSLIPVAKPGQRVLVGIGKKITEMTIHNGSLAVVETHEEEVGNVIKRVFKGPENFILTSINPVEFYEPIILPIEKIVKIWPIRGVLFENSND